MNEHVTLIDDPRLDSLYRYWLAKKRGRLMPSRADLDPVEIPAPIWPHTMILEVVHEAGRPRFRYRRVGAVFWNVLGHDPTGKFVDDVLTQEADYVGYVIGIYREMVERKSPMYTENVFELGTQGLPTMTKRVSLPLSSDGERVDMVLAGHVFDYDRVGRDIEYPRINAVREVTRAVLTEP